MIEFRMPSLGADMEAGTLVEWLVKPGDQVKRGDIVAVVETQKGAIEIEIFETGTIEKFLVDLGTKVPVGTPLALMRTQAELAGIGGVSQATAAPVASPAVGQPFSPPPGSWEKRERSVAAHAHISPAARRLARENEIDLADISGSGPGGTIVREDVERAVAQRTAQAARPARLNINAMRIAIAAAMARSKREIPHYYLAHQIEMTVCKRWLADANAERLPPDRILLGAILIKAVALAARRFPAFNGFCHEGKFEPADSVHIGVAVAIRGGGLIAPAIHDVDELPLDNLMQQLRALIERVRAGRIRASEIADPTITVSSLGDRGVETLYGIIYPPQVSIVGFGKVAPRPWVAEDKVVARSVVKATLAADHRVTDGHAGALFLAEIDSLLQEPEKL